MNKIQKKIQNSTHNEYGVLRTCAPSMYIDIDNIFIRQGCSEMPLHEYIHDLMVIAMKEVVNESCTKQEDGGWKFG